jgi:acyl phosphate:glycerol-3-phosphate acyltransferase
MALNLIIILTTTLIGYLFASFPSGVVIGKVFYKKDVRKFGSGGTGMTNVYRTLGIKAGIVVFILDLAKSTVPIWLASVIAYQWTSVGIDSPLFGQLAIFLSGVGTTLGHCYPIFAEFKGGKAVSSAGSFVVMTNWIVAVLGLAVMLTIIKTKKIVSIGSITGYFFAFLLSLLLFIPELSTIGMWNNAESGWLYSLFIFILWVILVYRHKENIQRLIAGKELDFKKKKQ